MTSPAEERPERELPPRPPTVPAEPRPLPPPPTRAGGGTAPGRQPFTRARAAWAGVWAGLVVVILLIIFIGQNTATIEIHFLWMDGRIPTALALLIAGVGGAIIALAAGAARIVQLRRTIRRGHR